MTYNWYSSANLGHKIILDKQRCYIRHFLVCIAPREAIIKHLLYNLEAFDFPLCYTKKYLIQKAMDEQYTSSNVDKYIVEKLQQNINLRWDPIKG